MLPEIVRKGGRCVYLKLSVACVELAIVFFFLAVWIHTAMRRLLRSLYVKCMVDQPCCVMSW